MTGRGARNCAHLEAGFTDLTYDLLRFLLLLDAPPPLLVVVTGPERFACLPAFLPALGTQPLRRFSSAFSEAL
jgi:hypothetical protein